MPAASSAGDRALQDTALPVARNADPRLARNADPRATVRHLVGRRVVAYHPSFAAIGGGVIAGLFLAQLFYWHDRGSDPDGWIYKTQAEWEEETGLSRWEQETARRRLQERGLLEEKLAGLPARLYYRLDVERLIVLLSAQVKRTPSPPAGGGSVRRPRVVAQPVATPRTGLRERHNQACGVATNKYVGKPHTSLRGCHTHAETTIEHTREQGAERLAGSLLEPYPPNPREPSPASSDEPSSECSSTSSLYEPSGEAPIEAPLGDAPSEVLCSLHGVPMRLREKDGDRWYSHRLPDGSWCKGAPGDQPDDGPEAEPDPWSIETRREYLAWADPADDPRSAASRRAYLAWLDPGAHLGLGGGDRRADRGSPRAVPDAVPVVDCQVPARGEGRASPPRPVTPRRADHAADSVDVGCDSAPRAAPDRAPMAVALPADPVAVTPTREPGGRRAPPSRPARPVHAVTPRASRGRSPPAPRALPVAVLEGIGIAPLRNAVRGPPSLQRRQTIEYRCR
jgi:hypothetical protein